MIILMPLVAALIVSYIIWQFNTRIMGKKLALPKVVTWSIVATFLVYGIFFGLSFF